MEASLFLSFFHLSEHQQRFIFYKYYDSLATSLSNSCASTFCELGGTSYSLWGSTLVV